jgi:hypothetical protein
MDVTLHPSERMAGQVYNRRKVRVAKTRKVTLKFNLQSPYLVVERAPPAPELMASRLAESRSSPWQVLLCDLADVGVLRVDHLCATRLGDLAQ